MRLRPTLTAVLAAGALGALGGTAALGGSAALAADDSRRGGQSIDTKADLTPFDQFTPLPNSSPCVGELSGRQAQPFVIPEGFEQQVVAEEGDRGTNTNTDNWDMSTQNEFGKDAGRYVYRTHENRRGQASQVSLTDLQTGQSKVLAERQDWEAFDGIVWTPWGTILAAEEVITASARDPQAPQAVAGLVYEFFIDRDDPSKLDPSRERIAPGDGTSDTVQDGIRVRPALGAKSHEGMRFDRRGNLYGIAESRGRTTAGQSGGIFRFVPDRKGDLSTGRLQAFQSPNRQDGEGVWVDLDRTQVQIDADREAETKGANEYQRPEDVETGQSTGKGPQQRRQHALCGHHRGRRRGRARHRPLPARAALRLRLRRKAGRQRVRSRGLRCAGQPRPGQQGQPGSRRGPVAQPDRCRLLRRSSPAGRGR